MERVLVDTSVWIDFFNGQANTHTKELARLIEQEHPIAICPVILQEVLQGIRSDKEHDEVADALKGFEMLLIDPVAAALGASALYRSMRKKGSTVSTSNDCLIAFYAISSKAKLLHNDKDFERIAKHAGLRLYKLN